MSWLLNQGGGTAASQNRNATIGDAQFTTCAGSSNAFIFTIATIPAVTSVTFLLSVTVRATTAPSGGAVTDTWSALAYFTAKNVGGVSLPVDSFVIHAGGDASMLGKIHLFLRRNRRRGRGSTSQQHLNGLRRRHGNRSFHRAANADKDAGIAESCPSHRAPVSSLENNSWMYSRTSSRCARFQDHAALLQKLRELREVAAVSGNRQLRRAALNRR